MGAGRRRCPTRRGGAERRDDALLEEGGGVGGWGLPCGRVVTKGCDRIVRLSLYGYGGREMGAEAAASESAAADGHGGSDDAPPAAAAGQPDFVTLAGQERMASGTPPEQVLVEESRAATQIAAGWRGARTRRQLQAVEYVDSEGNVVGRRGEAQVTFDEVPVSGGDIVFDDELPHAFEQERAGLGPSSGPRNPSWIKLRRVKDEFLGVTKDGVIRWSYAYTLDDRQFLSGRSLDRFSAENAVRQGVFVIMSHKVVEAFILMCKRPTSLPRRSSPVQTKVEV